MRLQHAAANAGMVVLLLALATNFSAAGCAVLASANASHSRISPCVEDRSFTLIDLGIAAGSGVALLVTDTAEESPGWLILPGVFFLSTVLGVVGTERCRRGKKKKSAPVDLSNEERGPVLYRSKPLPPSHVQESEEVYLPPIPEHGNPLKLRTDYLPPEDSASDPSPLACGLTTKMDCPDDQLCMITEGQDGICVPPKAAPVADGD